MCDKRFAVTVEVISGEVSVIISHLHKFVHTNSPAIPTKMAANDGNQSIYHFF